MPEGDTVRQTARRLHQRLAGKTLVRGELRHPRLSTVDLKGREVLESFGASVTGYRSPAWDFSANTLDLLEKHGFAYSSNLMDDIRPYLHEGTSVVELPVQWILDDAAHFWFDPTSWDKKISSVEEVRAIWEPELEGIRELGGACVFTMHPQVSGRPGRLPLLASTIALAKSHDDLWIATAAEIAGAAR